MLNRKIREQAKIKMTTQKPHPEDYTREFLAGVIGGLVLGGLLALWNAPASGAESLARLKGLLAKPWAQWRDESVEESLATGRALAQQHRARQAHPALPDPRPGR
jgi:hypothetical protein